MLAFEIVSPKQHPSCKTRAPAAILHKTTAKVWQEVVIGSGMAQDTLNRSLFG
jgi:hypothetical protein